MTQQYDVIVVGGGIIGLTAALAMAKRNFTVALIDTGALGMDTCRSQRVYAINKTSQNLFETLQIWPFVNKDEITFFNHMHVWDAANNASIDLDSHLVASPALGAIITESALKNALLQEAAHQPNLRCFPFNALKTVDSSNKQVIVNSDKHRWEGKLLLIADGAQSVTRQILNIPVRTWPYHQHAIVATVQTAKPHNNTAYQVFNPDRPLTQ